MNDCQQSVSFGDERSSTPHLFCVNISIRRPLRKGLGGPDGVHEDPGSQLVVDLQELARRRSHYHRQILRGVSVEVAREEIGVPVSLNGYNAFKHTFNR